MLARWIIYSCIWSVRTKRGTTLFEPASIEKRAPRPLADKLGPQKLTDVVGRDHLLGPDGALTRMLKTRWTAEWLPRAASARWIQFRVIKHFQ